MKFSIRDLFLVTMIVAILVAWWLDHRSLAPDAKQWRDAMADWQRATEAQGAELQAEIEEFKRTHDEFPRRDPGPMPGMPNSSAPAPNPREP